MWPSRPHLNTDVLPTNPPLSLPHKHPTVWGSHAHWHDGLRTARTDRVWMGWNCVGDPLRSSDGWALFSVVDDLLCDGWWMVDGGGAGSRGLGWPRLDGVLPLTLTHSPVSRLSRWLGWPRSSGSGESPRITLLITCLGLFSTLVHSLISSKVKSTIVTTPPPHSIMCASRHGASPYSGLKMDHVHDT